jgi:hypothetical protein
MWGAGYRPKLFIIITVFNDAMPAATLSDVECNERLRIVNWKHFGNHSGVFRSIVYLEEGRNVRKTYRVEDPKRLPAEYESKGTSIIILNVIILKKIVGKEDCEGV